MEAEVIDHYARSVEYDIREDGVIVRCFGRAMGYLADGEFKYVDPFWRDVYSRHLELSPLDPTKKEDDYRSEVVRKLVTEGWSTEVEVYTPYGRIDILAWKNNQTIIVEVKLRGDNVSVTHALGQLLFYKRAYPDAQLFITTATPMSDNAISILSAHGVTTL